MPLRPEDFIHFSYTLQTLVPSMKQGSDCCRNYPETAINIHRLSRWFFIFGLLALYYQQRASRAYDDLAVMRLLLATRKRAFLVLNFLHLWLCPSFIFFLIFLLSCLLFYPCFFFFFCFFLIPFSSALFFVHRQSLS